MSPLVILHVLLGSVALLCGAAALTLRKGALRHRQFGRWFVYSMLGMSASGAILAAMAGVPISVLAGGLTFYLVASAWLTLRSDTSARRRLEWIAFFMALATAAFGGALGSGLLWPEMVRETGFPLINYRIFASIALFAAVMDLRWLVGWGTPSRIRIIRHLWRITLAMLIATMSLFLGQARLFPETLQNSGLLNLPILAVLLSLFYHLLIRTIRLRRNSRHIHER